MKKIIVPLILIFLLLLSCKEKKETASNVAVTSKVKTPKILFILSNANFYGNSTIKTANHFLEIILPYDEFTKAGYTVDFVSPNGGKVPIGYIDDTDEIQKKYLQNKAFLKLLETTNIPKNINPSNYAAVFYGGGGAAMFGVPENKEIQNIAMSVYQKNKGIVAAVCHGSAGLVHLKNKEGKYLVSQKKVNGYPDQFEDKNAPYYKTFPFSIEQKLKENGAIFTYSKKGWDNFSIADGRLITGQDPTAARSVAKKVIKTLIETK